METLTYDKAVLDTLRKSKSLALVELSSILGIDATRLSTVIHELEQQRLVKVTGKGDILNEIVTATTKALQDIQ